MGISAGTYLHSRASAGGGDPWEEPGGEDYQPMQWATEAKVYKNYSLRGKCSWETDKNGGSEFAIGRHNDAVNKPELPSAQRKELKNELKSQNIKTTIW